MARLDRNAASTRDRARACAGASGVLGPGIKPAGFLYYQRRRHQRQRLHGRHARGHAACRRLPGRRLYFAAFARVEAVRGETPLTYFEFGTLAAVDIFRRARVDIAILEVGLGGRLDAVNAWDADVSIVASIGIDHTEWLGPDRESIGREKAG